MRAEVLALVTLPALVLLVLWALRLAGPLVAGALLVVGAALMMGERNPLALILLPAGALGAGWLRRFWGCWATERNAGSPDVPTIAELGLPMGWPCRPC